MQNQPEISNVCWIDSKEEKRKKKEKKNPKKQKQKQKKKLIFSLQTGYLAWPAGCEGMQWDLLKIKNVIGQWEEKHVKQSKD